MLGGAEPLVGGVCGGGCCGGCQWRILVVARDWDFSCYGDDRVGDGDKVKVVVLVGGVGGRSLPSVELRHVCRELPCEGFFEGVGRGWLGCYGYFGIFLKKYYYYSVAKRI